jgi:ATP-dependent exoDNAse (exonuclease V) alpha subunit
MDKDMIITGQPCIDWRVSYQLGKIKDKYGELRPREFAFGYAITCHKAQGSEWEKVLTIEERFPFDRTEHARWLYTACTRASDKLVLVRPE